MPLTSSLSRVEQTLARPTRAAPSARAEVKLALVGGQTDASVGARTLDAPSTSFANALAASDAGDAAAKAAPAGGDANGTAGEVEIGAGGAPGLSTPAVRPIRRDEASAGHRVKLDARVEATTDPASFPATAPPPAAATVLVQLAAASGLAASGLAASPAETEETAASKDRSAGGPTRKGLSAIDTEPAAALVAAIASPVPVVTLPIPGGDLVGLAVSAGSSSAGVAPSASARPGRDVIPAEAAAATVDRGAPTGTIPAAAAAAPTADTGTETIVADANDRVAARSDDAGRAPGLPTNTPAASRPTAGAPAPLAPPILGRDDAPASRGAASVPETPRATPTDGTESGPRQPMPARGAAPGGRAAGAITIADAVTASVAVAAPAVLEPPDCAETVAPTALRATGAPLPIPARAGLQRTEPGKATSGGAEPATDIPAGIDPPASDRPAGVAAAVARSAPATPSGAIQRTGALGEPKAQADRTASAASAAQAGTVPGPAVPLQAVPGQAPRPAAAAVPERATGVAAVGTTTAQSEETRSADLASAPPGGPVLMDGLAVAAPGAAAPHAFGAAVRAAGASIAVAQNVPLGNVPIEIGLKSLAGINHFEIRLSPDDLGQIDVRLDIDGAGHVKARLVVDRPETLAFLQRDSAELHQALEQAGLKTQDGAVTMSLRDGSGQTSPQASDQGAGQGTGQGTGQGSGQGTGSGAGPGSWSNASGGGQNGRDPSPSRPPSPAREERDLAPSGAPAGRHAGARASGLDLRI